MKTTLSERFTSASRQLIVKSFTRFLAILSVCVSTLGYDRAGGSELPFTIVVIPDSQSLVGYDQQSWLRQCRWIVNNQAAQNIKAVVHVGDLVDDAQQPYQWTNALTGLNLIKDAGIPLILAPGNHDMDMNGLSQQMTNLTRWLPHSWFTSNPNWSGGFLDESNLTGSYLLVTNGTTTCLLVALAWVPDERSVNWGKKIMQQFGDCPAIFVTHCFVDDTPWGRRASWTEQASIERIYGDQGPWWTPNRLWADWLSKSTSLFWVISGHFYARLNSMYFSQPADDGHLVTQSLCNYQGRTGGGNGGIMQLMTVYPEQNQCHIKTFDPGTSEAFTNWNENYTFPMFSNVQEHFSLWQQAQAAATNGLILWNGFDRTNQNGFVGLSPYSLTLTGAVTVAPGGIYVNCYPAYSNMVATTDLDALTGLSNLTVSVWYKATNAPPSGLGIIAGKFNAGTDGEWYLGTFSPSRLRLALVNTNNVRANLDLSTPTPLTDGKWHFIVATYDSSSAEIYFDGDLLGGMPYTGRLKGTRRTVSFGGLEGQTTPYNSASTPWGWLDRVKVWNRSLAPEEIVSEYVHDLATLDASRTNNVTGNFTENSSTNMNLVTQPGAQYVLRFAVAGNPQIASQQRMVVSWDGNPVADLSLIQTNTSGPTNWIYTSLLVSSTNATAKVETEATVGDPGSISNTNSEVGPLLAAVNVVSFTPLILPAPVIASGTNIIFDVPAYPGLAYQLEGSQDFVNWTPASHWVVASGTNVVLKTVRNSYSKRFYRVQLKW